MSDSDSDALHVRIPGAKKLEFILRDVVQKLQRSGKSEELTVNGVRAAAEGRLGLEAGYFKNGDWKEKSKAIIRDQADREPSPEQEPTQSKLARGKKRKSPDTEKLKKQQQKQKKRKTNDESEDVNSGAEKSNDSVINEKSQSGIVAATNADLDESSLSDLDMSEDKGVETQERSKTAPTKSDSESELSVLDDDDPPPKKRSRKKGSSSTSAAQTKRDKTSKARQKKEATGAGNGASWSDPDKEEIKRLQGWLVKCGIRKLWGKELAPYESGKAKIKHLRDMLADAGMTGRYSQEKARQIKESRELAADLEAVREGERMWGTKTADSEASEDDEKEKKPRRRLAKGLKELEFISDGEETD